MDWLEYFPDSKRTAVDLLDTLNPSAMAADLYHRRIFGAKEAKKWWGVDRGLDPKTVRRFKLGWAPPNSKTLTGLLSASGLQEFKNHGLVREGENGFYDAFRNRIIFPIANREGDIIGFSGRILENGSGPKYVNTEQTERFNKGEELYALNLAADQIKSEKAVIVVEGYMDAIRAHEKGFTHTVAVMGTAFTEKHLETLSAMAASITLMMDGDKAGASAAISTVERLAVFPSVHKLRFAACLEGEDPDSLLQKRGVEEFKHCLSGAISPIELILRGKNFVYPADTLSGQALRLTAISPLWESAGEEQRAIYASCLARHLSMDKSLVTRLLAESGAVNAPQAF